MRPILSLRDLASRLGVSPGRLREIASEIDRHYSYTTIQTGRDKFRQLRVPKAELKSLQRRINRNVLRSIALGGVAHGGVVGRSPASNAGSHLGTAWVINLDVRDFFPSVRHYVVYRMFRRDLGFGRDVARLLTRLTTLDAQLPQGAPTSTAVANLVLTVPVDEPAAALADRSGATYTRFVDDITLSGLNPRALINHVAKMLSRRRLSMYRKKSRLHSRPKLKITPNSRAQQVTGLNVNSTGGPSVPRKYRDDIRAAVFKAHRMVDGSEREQAIRSINGKIAYVKQFNPGAARRLLRYLNA